MDAWTTEPGARVEGHRAAVHERGASWQVSCTCGRSAAQPSVGAACLALVMHLEAAVRDGARVVRDEDDSDDGGGSAGVREPRRPVPSSGGGTAGLDLA